MKYHIDRNELTHLVIAGYVKASDEENVWLIVEDQDKGMFPGYRHLKKMIK